MAANARPKLDQLFAKKGTEAPPAANEPEKRPETPAKAETAGEGAKDTRVQVPIRMTKEERKALQRIALENDTTVQDLGEEALRDIIKRYKGDR